MSVVKLSTALQEMTRLMEVVEAIEEVGGEIPDDLVPLFDGTVGEIKNGIDRRIHLIENAEMLIGKFELELKYIQRRIQTLNRIKTNIKESTKLLMEGSPDISFEGSVKRFRLATNGGPAPILYAKGDRTFQTVKNVLDLEDVSKVPSEYIEWTKVPVLKKKEFEDDLRKGDLLSELASLAERGKHLRIA